MDPIITPPVPPSGTPGSVAPAVPAALVAAAPSAAAPVSPPSVPKTMADFAKLAAADLQRSGIETPAAPAGLESPPATPAPASAPAPVAPAVVPPITPVQTSELAATPAPVTPAPAGDEDEPEVPAEEQAAWTDGERKLYGALRKEREKRKEARAESKQLRDDIEQLKAKVAAPPANPSPNPAAPSAAVPEPAATPAPVAPTGAAVLADCNTFEQVDARAMQAAAVQADALHLQTVLAQQGKDAALQLLSESGVEKINGTALAEVTDRQLSDWAANVYKGALLVTTHADSRKQYLTHQAMSWVEATKLIPELKDSKSARAQRFAAIVNGNPFLRQQGSNWPIIAAKYLLGDESATTRTGTAAPKTTPAPAAPAAAAAPTAPPAPAARALPSAPRNSAAALPAKTAYEEAAERVRNGKATMADIQLMAKASIDANASAAQPAR